MIDGGHYAATKKRLGDGCPVDLLRFLQGELMEDDIAVAGEIEDARRFGLQRTRVAAGCVAP